MFEAKVYEVMQGAVGIPRLLWAGTEGDKNILVLELLGPNLQELLTVCERQFSLATAIVLADQMASLRVYIGRLIALSTSTTKTTSTETSSRITS